MFGLIDCILVVVCYFVLYIGIYCMSLHNKIMPYLMLHFIMYMVCCLKECDHVFVFILFIVGLFRNLLPFCPLLHLYFILFVCFLIGFMSFESLSCHQTLTFHLSPYSYIHKCKQLLSNQLYTVQLPQH